MVLFFCVALHDLVTLGVGICELWWYWKFWIQIGGIRNLVEGGFGKNGRALGIVLGFEILVEFSIQPKFHSEKNIFQLKKYYAHYLHPIGQKKAY